MVIVLLTLGRPAGPSVKSIAAVKVTLVASVITFDPPTLLAAQIASGKLTDAPSPPTVAEAQFVKWSVLLPSLTVIPAALTI